MTSLFNYNTLKVSLKKDSRTLVVELNRPERQNAINSEMIFELEGLFAWCASRIEIHSILLTGNGNVFCSGLDEEEAKNIAEEKFIKNMHKLQKLIYAMFYLPQTIVVDLKDGASNLGAELALGADIRLARTGTKLAFNHLQLGFSPACGGVGFLNALVSKSYARNWLLHGRPIVSEALLASGFMTELYNSEEAVNQVLNHIATQAPIARIQAKRALLESIINELDHALQFEAQVSNASLATGDLKKALNGKNDFLSAQQMTEMLRSEKVEQQAN